MAGNRLKWSVAEVLDDPSSRVMGRTVRESGWGEHLRVLPGSERTEIHNHRTRAPEAVPGSPPPGAGPARAGPGADRLSALPRPTDPAARGSRGRPCDLVSEPSLFAVTGVQRALERRRRCRPSAAHQPDLLQPLGVVTSRVFHRRGSTSTPVLSHALADEQAQYYGGEHELLQHARQYERADHKDVIQRAALMAGSEIRVRVTIVSSFI